MKTAILTLATLAEAAPEAAADFLEKLNAAVLDCKAHISDKPRVVTLKLNVTPQIGSKTPSKEHESFVARGNKLGQLKFDFVVDEE